MSTQTTPPLTEHLPAGSFQPAPSADGMPTIAVEAARLTEVCQRLRDHPDLRFAVCLDVTAADHFGRTPRFDVVYHLTSPERRLRLRIRVATDGSSGPAVPSVSGIWPSANWQEREVYDMFGIEFGGHPDLRRLIMPDDWEGHPLRKDYPVQVKMPVRTYEPLQLSEEEFRANMAADRERRVKR
jgi:NADH-quinone oxidoreductase subunit C